MPEDNFFDDIKLIDEILEKEKEPTCLKDKISEMEKKWKRKIEEYPDTYKENLKKEAEEVDPRVMFLKLKKGFLELLGICGGADAKSEDSLSISNEAKNMASSIERQLSSIKRQLDSIEGKYDKQKELFSQAIKILEKSNIEDRVKKVEDNLNQGILKMVWKDIKKRFGRTI